MQFLNTRDKSSPFLSLNRSEHLFFVAIFLLMIAATVLAAFLNGETSLVRFLALALYLLLLLAPFLTPGCKPSFYHPIFFYVLWVSLRGLFEGNFFLGLYGVHSHKALDDLTPAQADIIVSRSFFIDSIALIGLYLGYLLSPIGKFPTMQIRAPKRPLLKTSIWIAAAAIATLILANAAGGIDSLLMQRGLVRSERVAHEIGAHWNVLVKFGPIAVLAWLACDGKIIRTKAFWILLILALLFQFMATGSRSGTIVPFLMITSVYAIRSRHLPYKAILVLGLASLIVVGALGEFRRATMKSSTLDEVSVATDITSWIQSAVEETFSNNIEINGQLAIAGNVPDEVPYLLGASYLSVPYIFLPRAIIGEKPPAGGLLVSDRFFGSDQNTIPPGTAGEAYWNFSYVGVMIVFLIYGVFLRMIASLYLSNPDHPLSLMVLLLTLFYFAPSSDGLYRFAQQTVPALLILYTLTGGVSLRRRVIVGPANYSSN